MGQKICTECKNGTFRASDDNLAKCRDCPIGFYQSNTAAATCIQCIPGQINPTPGKDECILCSKGKKRSAADPMDACVTCQSGYYQGETASTLCLTCVPGKAAAQQGAFECDNCDVNTFAKDTASSECKACALGKYTNTKGTPACSTCIAGRFGKACGLCPIGFYRTGDSSPETCFKCVEGQHQSLAGTTYCLQCEAGTFQPREAQALCHKCAFGYFEDIKRSVGPCRPCLGDLVGNKNEGATQCIAQAVDRDVPTPAILQIKPGATFLIAALTFALPMKSWRQGDTMEVQVSFEMDFDSIVDEKIYSEDQFDFLTQVSSDVVGEEEWKVGATIEVPSSLYHTQFYFRARVINSITSKRGQSSLSNPPGVIASTCDNAMYLSIQTDDKTTPAGKANTAESSMFVLFDIDPKVPTPSCA